MKYVYMAVQTCLCVVLLVCIIFGVAFSSELFAQEKFYTDAISGVTPKDCIEADYSEENLVVPWGPISKIERSARILAFVTFHRNHEYTGITHDMNHLRACRP